MNVDEFAKTLKMQLSVIPANPGSGFTGVTTFYDILNFSWFV